MTNEKAIQNFKCQKCKGKTEEVYRTNRNVFLKCKKGHPREGAEGKEFPVHMVLLKDFEKAMKKK
jgi:hypothetical protein